MKVTKQSVMSNLIWRFAERCGAQLVTLIVKIVLARLIAPAIFGELSLILIVSEIFQVFIDSGLGNALIQKKDADDLDFSSVFYFNLLFCIGLYILMFFVGAPVLANFVFKEPELCIYIRVVTLNIVISSLKNIQEAYVSIHLMFKKFFFATLIGTVISAVVGITMAYMGFEIWALVAQYLTNLIIDTFVLWLVVPWRPKKMFSWLRLKGLINYGWKLLVSALIDKIYIRMRSFVVGVAYSKEALGYYEQGTQFPSVIITNINTSINNILFPVMSKAQDDISKVREMTRKSIKVSMYLIAPLMIGLAVISDEIVRFLLTDKWLPAVPFIIVFSITYMFHPMDTANMSAIKAMGRSDYFLVMETIKKVLGFSVLFICAFVFRNPTDSLILAIAMMFVSFINTMINALFNKKLMHYGYFEQIKDMIPNLLQAILMGIVVFAVRLIPIPWLIVKIIVQILAGAVFYLGVSIITKNQSYIYCLELIKPLLSKFKRTKS